MKNAFSYALALVGLLVVAFLLMHCKRMNEENRYQFHQSVIEPTIVATNASQDAEVVVGANPKINHGQQFAAPMNSVVVTNEEHLRVLISQISSNKTNSQ